MQNRLFKSLLILSVLALYSCADNNVDLAEANFYTQGDHNRVAAEWEPAVGIMITWPLCIPYKLFIELARDNHLYTLVANETSKKEALEWYTKWGIDTTRNTFVYAPQGIDAWWVRDWGPRFCWQLMDPLWNPLNSVCDKTEAEMQASYLNPCTYSKIGDNYCWYIDNSIFIKDRPQDFIDHYQRCFGFTSAVNVACDYC